MKRLIIAVLVLLPGCGVLPYWIEAGPRQVVRSVERVPFERFPKECNRPHTVHGCTIHDGITARIYILEGLNLVYDQCVEKHERKEAAGWRHPTNKPLPYADCGDGTFVKPDGSRHYPREG